MVSETVYLLTIYRKEPPFSSAAKLERQVLQHGLLLKIPPRSVTGTEAFFPLANALFSFEVQLIKKVLCWKEFSSLKKQ